MSKCTITITFRNGKKVKTHSDDPEDFEAYLDLVTLPIVRAVEIKPEGVE